MFETIVWSKKTYSLKAFISSDRFFLPQLVQVESGIYSENEAKTLSQGQNLFMHFTKRTDKVRAKVTGKKEFFIPINFPCKVFILPTVCEDVYYSVRDIAHTITAKFFRVVHNSPPTFRLKAGDIMEIKRTFEENRGQYIECEFVNKTSADSVKLPLDYKAAFEPLATGKQYDFAEVLHCFRFPIRVKFVPGENILNAAVTDDIEWPPVGSVLLKEKIEESAVICTSRADGNVTVLLIPTDLDVTLRPALGALTGDKDYARFCKNIHDGVDLQKRIDLSSLNASKLCIESGDAAEFTVEVLYDYEEMKPPIPAKNPSGRQSEGCYDECYDIPVDPWPLQKPEKLKSPPKKTAKPTVLAPKPVPYSRESRKTGMKLCAESDGELDVLHDHYEKMESILPRNPSGPQSESFYDDVRVVAPSLCPRKPEMLKSPPIKATKPAVLAPKPRPADYRDGHFQGAMDSTRGLTAGNCLDNEVPPPVPIRTVSRPQHNILPETTGRGDPKPYHNVLPISRGKEHPSIQTAQTEPRKTAMTKTNKKVDQDIHERSSDDDFDDFDDDDDDDEYIYMDDPFLDGDKRQDSASSPSQPLLKVERKNRPEKIIKRLSSIFFS